MRRVAEDKWPVCDQVCIQSTLEYKVCNPSDVNRGSPFADITR